MVVETTVREIMKCREIVAVQMDGGRGSGERDTVVRKCHRKGKEKREKKGK